MKGFCSLKGTVSREKFLNRVCGEVGWVVGNKDVSDPYLIVLHCPFNLLCKTEFMLGPSLDVNLTSAI